jgi:hypothetical protein
VVQLPVVNHPEVQSSQQQQEDPEEQIEDITPVKVDPTPVPEVSSE